MISNQIHVLVQWYPILSPNVPPPSRFLSDPLPLQPGRCCVRACVCVCVFWLCCVACGILVPLAVEAWNPNHGPPGTSQALCPLIRAHVLHTGRRCYHLVPLCGGTFHMAGLSICLWCWSHVLLIIVSIIGSPIFCAQEAGSKKK